jgi:hypothetical protein
MNTNSKLKEMENDGFERSNLSAIKTIAINHTLERMVIANNLDEVIREFSLCSGECIENYDIFNKPVRKMIMEPDRIIGVSWDGFAKSIARSGLVEWEFDSGGKLAALDLYKDFVVVGSYDNLKTADYNIFYVIDRTSGRLVKKFFHSLSYGESLDCAVDSEDGSCYASSDEGTIIRFGVEPEDLVTRLIYTDEIPIRFIRFLNLAGNKFLLFGGSDHMVRSLRLDDHENSDTILYDGHSDKINGIAVLPAPMEDHFISTSEDATAILWKIGNTEPLVTLKGHMDWIWDATTYTKNNKTYLLTCGQDGRVLIFNTEGVLLGKFLNLADEYYMWIIPDHENEEVIYVNSNLENISENFIDQEIEIRRVGNLDRIWE